jgi:hypothetical protein
MGAPKPPAPQPDPQLAQLMRTAQQQQNAALQSEAAGDTASLLARYGARLALSGTSGGASPSPLFAGLLGAGLGGQLTLGSGGGLGALGRR